MRLVDLPVQTSSAPRTRKTPGLPPQHGARSALVSRSSMSRGYPLRVGVTAQYRARRHGRPDPGYSSTMPWRTWNALFAAGTPQ